MDFGDSGETLGVENIEHFDFAGWDIALFAAGSEVSSVYASKAARAGCTVIDNIVDCPAPLGPMRRTNSPLPISSVTSESAGR